MNRLLHWFYGFIVLGCGLVACSGPQPTTPAAPQPVEFKVIFTDKFDKDDKQWDRFKEDGKGEAGYYENDYRIRVTARNTQIWTNPQGFKPPDDVHITVKARKDSGESNNIFGVICRYANENNFYFLVISSDGHFGIGKVKDGKYQLLNRGDYPPAAEIKQGNATNLIQVVCEGSLLRLSVNDGLVDEQRDSDFKSGNIGLIAGTFGGETVIVFDDIEVRGP